MKGLVQLRNKFEYTQKELAELVGVDENTIRRYEKGIVFPSKKILIRLKDTFSCSFDDLLIGVNPTTDAENIVAVEREPHFSSEGLFNMTSENSSETDVLLGRMANPTQQIQEERIAWAGICENQHLFRHSKR